MISINNTEVKFQGLTYISILYYWKLAILLTKSSHSELLIIYLNLLFIIIKIRSNIISTIVIN